MVRTMLVEPVRFHIDAELAGRRFDSVILDVGFGDAEMFAPVLLKPPPLLAFADITSPEIPVLPVELHVAEKVHAYTRCTRPARVPGSRTWLTSSCCSRANPSRLRA
jgi:hypothetical protein